MSLLFANDRPGAYPNSWYAATAAAPDPFPELKGDRRADVCVVGGGFTGLSAALHLAGSGLEVALVEAHRVGFGASGRNGGQLGSGQRQDQRWLEARMGPGDARALWTIAEEAKALVHDLCARHAIDAAYKPGIVSAAESATQAADLHTAAEHLAERYDYRDWDPLDRAAIADITGSTVFAGGVLDRGAGHLHPLRLAFGMARAARASGVEIFEQSVVHHIHEGAEVAVRSGKGVVRARHVVLAMNGYHGGLNRTVAAKVLPINNFIVATAPLGPEAAAILPRDVAVADERFVVSYWRRSEDGRLLFGGGESYGDRFPRDIAAVVRKPLARIYPQLADIGIDHAWGGTLAITASRLPLFARPAANILAAGGYSGHGVALAVMAGRVLAEAICGQTGRFDVLSRLPVPAFPGGPAFRQPLLALAMTWYGLRDRLGL